MNADTDSATTIDAHTLLGTVENLTDAAVFLELRTQADGGTNRTVALPPLPLEIPASASTDVQVALDAFGFDCDALLYSGSVSVRLFVFETENAASYEVEYAPTLYFHPTDAGLLVYGEQLLRTTYNAGDYAGRTALEPEPDTVITRILQGAQVTYGGAPRTAEDLLAEGDDSTPPQGDEVIE